MRHLFAIVLLAASAAQAQTPAGDPVAACAVWDRETSFAQTVVDHDAAAFVAHLQAGAVFIGGDGNGTHGRDAIAKEWAGLIDGTGPLLRWYPDVVDVSGDGRTALSRGPYWMADPAAPVDRRYRVGRFISTWVRGDDGEWRVAFDGGGGNVARPATEAEIDALAAARKACPYR